VHWLAILPETWLLGVVALLQRARRGRRQHRARPGRSSSVVVPYEYIASLLDLRTKLKTRDNGRLGSSRTMNRSTPPAVIVDLGASRRLR
jgi:hypothetical protein